MEAKPDMPHLIILSLNGISEPGLHLSVVNTMMAYPLNVSGNKEDQRT